MLGEEAKPDSSESTAFLAAFAAALHSYRVDSVCRPRPPGMSTEELRRGLGAAILPERDGQKFSPQSPAAAITAFLEEARQLRLASPRSGVSALAADAAKSSYDSRAQAILAGRGGPPDIVLHLAPPRAAAFAVRAAGNPTRLAFHGTQFENVWPVLNHGLINLAQVDPRLARTGSIYGKGIYLSTDICYASGFAKPSAALPHGLGSWSCVFLCEVAPGPMVTVGGAAETAQAQSNGLAPRDAHNVPESVIVVEDSDAVVVRCALLYRHGGSSGAGLFSLGSYLSETTLAALVILLAVLYAVWAKTPVRRF